MLCASYCQSYFITVLPVSNFLSLSLSPSSSLYLIISIRSGAAWVLWVLLSTLRMRNACVCISNWKNIKHSSSAALTDSFLQQLLPKSLGQMQLASLQINVNKWQPQVQEALEIRLINHLSILCNYPMNSTWPQAIGMLNFNPSTLTFAVEWKERGRERERGRQPVYNKSLPFN